MKRLDVCLIGLSLLCVHWSQTKRLIQIIRIAQPGPGGLSNPGEMSDNLEEYVMADILK